MEQTRYQIVQEFLQKADQKNISFIKTREAYNKVFRQNMTIDMAKKYLDEILEYHCICAL